MELHGKNIIGGQLSARGDTTLTAFNPATGQALAPPFYGATDTELDEAMTLAAQAFTSYSRLPAERVAEFLDRIADEILGLGDNLLQRANAETALPEARLTAERGRTIAQLKMFAELVREGSWAEARIDRAQPERKPVPRPDLRRKLVPIGPIVVFGASNFPLAFSVAGGDTASALAAGNPVVVKAHSAHPGTSELVARAVQAAATGTGMPAGVFSMVHGTHHGVGAHLVRHPSAKAVGFTGSYRGGRALFDAAAARPEPIPVYAEMGSVNPVFVLAGALRTRAAAIGEGLVQSVTLGVGQFCTNPGLVFGVESQELASFAERASAQAATIAPGTMLYQAICDQFHEAAARWRAMPGVKLAGVSQAAARPGQAAAMIFTTDAGTYFQSAALREELFGPATLIVRCASAAELERAARELSGQLTAVIHGTEQDLEEHRELVAILSAKAGRLVFNGFPTGVEVCPAMHHGGPFPATTFSHFTSVGTAAINRFVRPVCFQNFPQAALPVELRDRNTRNLWRLVDGKMTRDDV